MLKILELDDFCSILSHHLYDVNVINASHRKCNYNGYKWMLKENEDKVSDNTHTIDSTESFSRIEWMQRFHWDTALCT